MTGAYAADPTFSPDASRIAFVHYNQVGIDPDGPPFADLYVGDVVRDGTTQAITGLVGITRVVDLFTIGQRTDTSASSYWTGSPEFSPDGAAIVIVAYDDLWKIDMSGNTMIGATALTRTTTFAEQTPRWSPAGRDLIAFSGGAYITDRQSGYTSVGSNQNIYALDLLAGTVRMVVTKTNQGTAGSLRTSPTWSPDASYLAFSAPGPKQSRSSPCAAGINTDIYKIRSDGSGSAVNVTMTTNTGHEHDSHWGWQ